jgi:hypothetical protein
MAITRTGNGYHSSDRQRWSLMEPGKSDLILADTEEEARSEAAKIPGAIVLPPASQQGAVFTNTQAAPAPVNLSPAAPAAAPTGAPVALGNISVTNAAIQGGVRITVNSAHATLGDKMSYVLQVRLNGSYFPIKQMLKGEVVNPASYTSSKTFDISYADIDKIFADAGHPELKVTPGVTEFGVLATFPTGHAWGLQEWGRGTELVAPAPLP